MLSFLNAANNRFLADVQRMQQRQTVAMEQVSSGVRVRVASDDPDHIDDLLSARAELFNSKQIKNNLDAYKTEVDTAETTLQGAIKAVEKIRTLGAQGLNDASPTNQRQIIANEVEGIFNQLVSASRASVQGRFLFSGDTDQTAPYAVDLTQPNGVTPYAGAPMSLRLAENQNGVRFRIAKTAEVIFDSQGPGQSVFAATNSLRAALVANDTTAIQKSLKDVETASNYLNDQLAFYGAAQNQISSAIDDSGRRQLSLTEQISAIQDADLPAAILELNQSKTGLEAAFQAHSAVPRKSLFEYLFG